MSCAGVWLDAEEIEKVRKILGTELKSRRKRIVRLSEVARRERELWKRREAEIASREASDTVSVGEWLFMFLTRLPREVYHPVRRFPAVVVALITANLLTFLIEVAVLTGPAGRGFFVAYGFVPDKLRHLEQVWGIVTSMFLHGGLGHLLGNMYYLYSFGDNVEDYLGPLRFTALYLLCGITANLSQFAVDVHSNIPVIGASGAIAGILGAYLLLFSRRKLYILIVFWPVKLGAMWYLGFWIAFQIVAAAYGGGIVAWFAHIGGFVTGLALMAGYQALRRTIPGKSGSYEIGSCVAFLAFSLSGWHAT